MDPIDRNEAIEAVGQLGGILLSPYLTNGKTVILVNFSDVVKTIEHLPSAQPERKKGKWVDGWLSKLDGTRRWFRECSECGYERDDDNPEKDTNFCPNCGLPMETEVEE